MSTVRDRLELVSHFPGRLRVRAATFRALPEVADEVSQRLSEEPGVSSVTQSRITGSLVVNYEPRVLQLPRLIDLLVRMGGLHGLRVDSPPDLAHRDDGARVRDTLGTVNRAVRAASKGHIDLRVALPGALASLGVAMFVAGRRRVPEWYDLLFWSFVTFSNLNPLQGSAGVGGRDGSLASE